MKRLAMIEGGAGAPSYMDFARAMADAQDRECETMKRWIGRGGSLSTAHLSSVRAVMEWTPPTRSGINVPKWKRCSNHFNREGRPT